MAEYTYRAKIRVLCSEATIFAMYFENSQGFGSPDDSAMLNVAAVDTSQHSPRLKILLAL